MATPSMYQPQTSQSLFNQLQKPPSQVYGPMPSSTFQRNFVNNVRPPAQSSVQGGSSAVGFTQSNNPQPQPQQPSGPSAQDLYRQQMEGSINAGWDSYLTQLDDMLNVGIPGQKTAQENIANETYKQGVNQLGTQKSTSEQAVEKQQTKSLKDIGENIQNLFQSGNIYLGSRGAGDSSAANQYSYAVAKIGTKARGDVMTQASDRMTQIGDIYNSEVNRLESEKNMRINEIADWFNQAQNAIRGQIGQAGLGRSKDIQALSTNVYNQALQAMQTLQSEQANRRAMLESWAASNAGNVKQLVSNMQTVQQMPAFQGVQGGMPQVTSEGNFFVPAGYGANSAQRKDIFGNIIG